MNDQDYRSRKLHVELSSKGGVKRTAETIIARRGQSDSPAVDANGTAGSPPAMSITPAGPPPTDDRRDRTIGLMNIPDTVNDSRIRSMVEPYGALVKIVLRPDHQGAIVEYVDVNDAGKASLGLEGHEIAPGRKIRVGSVAVMLKQDAERKVDRIQVGGGKSKKEGDKSTVLQGSVQVKRPGQGAARGGRRGGLGAKRGLGFGGTPSRNGNDEHTAAGAEAKTRSNNDFREMLSKPKGSE